jgi:hypothetical protein
VVSTVRLLAHNNRGVMSYAGRMAELGLHSRSSRGMTERMTEGNTSLRSLMLLLGETPCIRLRIPAK